MRAMTDAQAPYDWQFLLDIFYYLGRLDHPLYSEFASQDSVLASQVFASQEERQKARQEARKNVLTRAIRSGKVAVQGCRDTSLGLETPERIEAKIDAETEINISLNEITLRKVYDIPATDKWPARKDRLEIALFKRVQADRANMEQRLREAADDGAPDDVEADGKAEESRSPDAIPVLDKKSFPPERKEELKAFLVDHARKQESMGKRNNDEIALAEAERHFNASIPRETVRTLRREAGCLGKQGAPRKSPEKSAE
jgi:hypothetical protein